MNKKIILIYTILLLLLLFLNKNCNGYEIISLNSKIKNYIININDKLSENQYDKITNSIIKQSNYYNVPLILTIAITEAESTFNQYAVSKVGAKGLMQIYTLECCGIKFDESRLFEIEYNIACGLCIFKDKLKMSDNNYVEAIYKYNGKGKEARKYTLKVLNILNKIKKHYNKGML